MYQRTVTRVLMVVALMVIPRIAVAGNIVVGSNFARFYDTDSLINFGLAQGNVIVTNSEVTGYAWAEDWGWINLQPTQSGVKNDGNGNLSGFAWGETLGWINFDPTFGGVSIDANGFFSGYAWAENGGWIVFSCETDASCGILDHRVQTTWSADSGGGSSGGGSFVGDNGSTTPTPLDPLPDDILDSPERVPSDTEPSTDDDAFEESVETPLPAESIDSSDETSESSEGSSAPGSPSSEEPHQGRGGGGALERGALEILDSVGGVVKAAWEGVENAQSVSRAFLLDNPERAIAIKTGSGVVAGVGSVVAGATLFATPAAFAEIVFLPARLVSLILALFGYKRKRYPWGTVYDSVTKQPLDPAYVKLIPRSGEESTGSLTDLDGRYGFHVNPGTYVLEAGKTHYLFPSKRLQGKEADIMYNGLYFGEEVLVDDTNSVITRNIPLDPVGFDWNEYMKKRQHLTSFYSRFDVLIYGILSLLFYGGLALSSVLFVAEPSFFSGFVLLVYVVIVLVRHRTPSPARLGKLREKSSQEPLSFAIVRVILDEANHEVKRVVADRYGRYYCLVTPGTYRVEIDKKVGTNEYQSVFVSEPFDSPRGIIQKSFQVE